MKTRVAVMSIIVDEKDSVEVLNAVLHEFGDHIIGRMGIPYRQRGIHIISIALDAPPLLRLWRNHLFPRRVRLSCSFQRYSRPLLVSVSPCACRKEARSV